MDSPLQIKWDRASRTYDFMTWGEELSASLTRAAELVRAMAKVHRELAQEARK